MTTQPGTPPAGASPFRFFDGQFAANPFPMLAQMRAMGAIVEVPLPYSDGTHKAWMVTRMEEVTLCVMLTGEADYLIKLIAHVFPQSEAIRLYYHATSYS